MVSNLNIVNGIFIFLCFTEIVSTFKVCNTVGMVTNFIITCMISLIACLHFSKKKVTEITHC